MGFIDINTKQKPVPSQLLLDIKNLAEIESESEATLRDIFDKFDKSSGSNLFGYMAPFETAKSKITRVTFNSSIKPLLEYFPGRSSDEVYEVLNSYIGAVRRSLKQKSEETNISKPVVFRAFLAIFPSVVQRVQDKFGADYSEANFFDVVSPMFNNMPRNKLEKPGTSWVALKEYFEKRLRSKLSI